MRPGGEEAGGELADGTRAGDAPRLELLAPLLAALAAIGPFSIDTYLPSFPEIGAKLGATPLEVQQTLTAYLLPFAVMTLWHGALSDALGRRRVILVALALFGVASFGCAFATRIEHLWLLRALQGITAGAGMVVGRAIVRDVFDGAMAQKVISHAAIAFALAPAVAPVVGGWLQTWFGWRSVFVFLTLMTAVLWTVCWRLLPETLPESERQPLHPAYLAKTYARVLTTPAFLTVCGALALNFAAFFIYVMSAPEFLMHHLGLSERSFLWLFGPAMAGMMAGSWVSARIAGRLSLAASASRGYWAMAAGAAINLILAFTLPPGVPWSTLHFLFYNFGMSIAMPALTVLALDLFPQQRGLASSCQGFLQTGSNSLVAALIAPALWGSTRTLAIGMAGILCLGFLSFVLYRRASPR